ncbi:hypothetical protein [Pseudomonas japonica]|uniref:hypothetical protein n=1 Tax=Pseudomonas japonica TaxID=256466 RepID=UPI0015E39965|nr:hypothetical protein [Pseudomonas japonica]MBA1287320.1 hypothetical protein [Pseudomonas japonica]
MRTPDSESQSLLPAEVPDALPALAGEPPNLLPTALLAQPVKVRIPRWGESGGLGQPKVRIYWDGALVHEVTLPSDFTDEQLSFELGSLSLAHGSHQLHYDVKLGNGSVVAGPPLEVNVDLVPPDLDQTPARLGFPPEVVTGEVTDDYLISHGDQLQATVPLYGGQAPGDRIDWYWDRQLNANEPVHGSLVAELSPAMTVTFAADLIRARGDGQRFAHYRITDYAGNTARSAAVQLAVRATPVPRILPLPQVTGATGSGNRQNLKAVLAVNGITVKVPEEAVIKPGEQARLLFGTPGETGGLALPISQAGALLPIGPETVAAHLDRTVAVRYEVTDAQGGVHLSEVLQLTLTESAGLNFPTVQCSLVDGTQLSLRRVPSGGATITLAAWRLMTDYQCLMVRINGVDSAGQVLDEAVVSGRRVQASEVGVGVGYAHDLLIPRALLSRLRLNTPFYVQAYLSFDGSEQWPPAPTFKDLVPTLVP